MKKIRTITATVSGFLIFLMTIMNFAFAKTVRADNSLFPTVSIVTNTQPDSVSQQDSNAIRQDNIADDQAKGQETQTDTTAAPEQSDNAEKSSVLVHQTLLIIVMFFVLGVSVAALVLMLMLMIRMPKKEKKSKKQSDKKDNKAENENDDSNTIVHSLDSDNTFSFVKEMLDVEDDIKGAFRNALERKQGDFEKKQKELNEQRNKELEDKIDELEKKINGFDKEKESAINEATKVLTKKISGLETEKEQLNQEHRNELKKKDNECKNKINEINTAHNKEIERLNNEYQETLSKYSKHIKIYKGCESFSKAVMQLFEITRTLHQKQVELYDKVHRKGLKDDANDEFNYYYTNVVNKYEKAIKEFDVNKFEKEFYILNEAGIALSNQTIDSYLTSSETKKYEENLRHNSYFSAGFGKFCAAAVVLSDDLKSLSRFCKDSVSENDVSDFKQITKDLLKTIKELGYEPAYVELFHPLKEYSKIAEAMDRKSDLEGFNEDDIVEVLKMAVNFEDRKEKTQVCIK